MFIEPSPLRDGRQASPFLTQKQTAELLQVSERTLERWRVDGNGPPFIAAGRRILYSVAAIEAWATARTFGSTSERDVAAARASR